MKRSQKKALYESIMKSVAKTIKRSLNEGNINPVDLVERTIDQLSDEYPCVENLYDYTITPTQSVATVAVSMKNRIIYVNPTFIDGLSNIELEVVILHEALHIEHVDDVEYLPQAFTPEENIRIDELINNEIISFDPRYEKALENMNAPY